MRTVLIACGNPLRGDDGAAHRVLELLGAEIRAEVRSVLQLTPELASEIADADAVIFLDAAVDSRALSVEPVGESAVPPAFTHASSPAEIIALSTVLFGFKGRAFQLRIPVADLAAGEGLSLYSEHFAAEAARLLLGFRAQPDEYVTLPDCGALNDLLSHALERRPDGFGRIR